MQNQEKKKRLIYSKEQIQNSLNLLNDSKNPISIRSISLKFGIPESTLRRYKKNNITTASEIKKSGPSTILSIHQEQLLINWIQTMQILHTPVSKTQIITMIRQYLNNNDYKISDKWWIRFQRDNPKFRWRNTESLDKVRVDSSSINSVTNFFVKLEALLNEKKYAYIWNMDESAINGDPKKKRRVFVDSSIPIQYDRTVMNASHVTLVVAINNAGGFIPPMLIFKGKRLLDNLLNDSPDNTAAAVTENGWMDKNTCVGWFQHFIKNAPTSRPQLIILDGSSTHVSSELGRLGQSNKIDILMFPPNLTHIMQPLDLSVFGPLKTYMKEEINKSNKIVINKFNKKDNLIF
jgi:hypothetical protein